MPRNERLRAFAKDMVATLGEFGPKYVSPLRAFLSMADEPESTREVLEHGLTQESLKSRLDEILSNDEMLAKCCGNSEKLAHALDRLFFGPLPDALYYGRTTLLGFEVGLNALDEELDKLEETIYGQGDFSKTAYFHLYNVHISANISHPDSAWRVEQLSFDKVKEILEPAAFSEFLGTYSSLGFAIRNDSSGFNEESLSDWLIRRWSEAAEYCKTLQLAHEGTADLDYVIAQYNPPWVNLIQGGGVFKMGTPRKNAAPSGLSCFLTSSEEISQIWKVARRYVATSNQDQSRLKRAISIATEFFEESHRKATRIERFANLMIALEALYTPSDKAELTLRVSQTCAVFVAGPLAHQEPLELYKFLKTMFNRRGSLFHGNYDANSLSPESFISDEELKRLYYIVRKSIVGFIILYLRGERQLDEIRQTLEVAILDPEIRETLLEKAQLENLPPGEIEA